MQNRMSALAACVLVIAAIVVLAPALGGLRFEPARALTRSADFANPPILAAFRIDETTSVWDIMLVWLGVVIPLVLVVLLLPPELRKRVLQQVVRFALFVLALVLALRYRLIHLPEIEMGDLAAGQAGSQMLAGSTESEAFTAPVLSPWLTYVISFALFAILAVGLTFAYKRWRRNRTHSRSALSTIAAVARESLSSLAEGRPWGGVIVEAYARMVEAARLARGLHRDVSWTPREFAARLARNGLPASAVDELTQLFEAARYGAMPADEKAQRRAAACLESILHACQVAA